MGAWELLLVGVVMLLGLCGVLVPGVPGSWLVWAGTAWWALQDPNGIAWGVLVGATFGSGRSEAEAAGRCADIFVDAKPAMSIAEAQRSFTYFHLYGYPTDLVVANRVLPDEVGDYFRGWYEAQQRYGPLVEALYGSAGEADISTEVTFEDGRTGMIKHAEQFAKKKIPFITCPPAGRTPPASTPASPGSSNPSAAPRSARRG